MSLVHGSMTHAEVALKESLEIARPSTQSNSVPIEDVFSISAIANGDVGELS